MRSRFPDFGVGVALCLEHGLVAVPNDTTPYISRAEGARPLGSDGKSVTNMSEAIPLRPTLSIQRIQIVVSSILSKRLDLMLEMFAMEGRDLGDVQR